MKLPPPQSAPSGLALESDINPPKSLVHSLTDDGTFPNNAELPLIVYRDALTLAPTHPAARFETLFAQHHWGHSWRNGIYDRHHYHSTAHEVLGIYSGQAAIQFGGEQGPVISIQSGDVVIVPAGVAHKNVGSSLNFGVVGAYPLGQEWDTCFGKPSERPQVLFNIAEVSLPQADPVYGPDGPLTEYWQEW